MCTEQDLKQIVSAVVDEYCDQLTDDVTLMVREHVDYLRADNLRPIDWPKKFNESNYLIIQKAIRIDAARSLKNILLESIEDHVDEGLIHAGDAERTRQREEA